jgi:hypothetical protein
MSLVAGTAFFTIDGVQFSLRGTLNIKLGAIKREAVMGLDQLHGFKEVPEASYIECELTDLPQVDWNVIEKATGVTIQTSLINGKVAMLPNASQVLPIELNADDGKLKVRFEGPKGEWIIPAA